MLGWEVRVGHGWRDQMPPDVAALIKMHDGQGKLGVLCVNADAHLDGFQGCGDIMFYGASQDMDAVASAYDAVAQFLKHMNQDEVDVASLIFVNLKPNTFSLSPHPESSAADVPSIVEGLRLFLQAVVGSIHDQNLWSLCEWAMLSCSRKA